MTKQEVILPLLKQLSEYVASTGYNQFGKEDVSTILEKCTRIIMISTDRMEIKDETIQEELGFILKELDEAVLKKNIYYLLAHTIQKAPDGNFEFSALPVDCSFLYSKHKELIGIFIAHKKTIDSLNNLLDLHIGVEDLKFLVNPPIRISLLQRIYNKVFHSTHK